MTTRVCRLRTVRPKAPQVNQVVRPLQSVTACPQACSINIISEVKTSSQTCSTRAGQDERKTKNETSDCGVTRGQIVSGCGQRANARVRVVSVVPVRRGRSAGPAGRRAAG